MPSLADLGAVLTPSEPTGFRLGQLELAGGIAQGEAEMQRGRILQDFTEFQLPQLMSSQAARGAGASSATWDKRRQLATGASRGLEDVEAGLARTQAGLAGNSLLAQTGISLSGY